MTKLNWAIIVFILSLVSLSFTLNFSSKIVSTNSNIDTNNKNVIPTNIPRSVPTTIPEVSTETQQKTVTSPNQQLRAIHNDETKSLQIIDLTNNKIVYELKDKINPNLESDNPNSGNLSFLPSKWSPDSKNLVYEIWSYEIYNLGLIANINNKFTNSVTWLNIEPKYSNCGKSAWSPDSKKVIIFGYNRSPCTPSLYIIDSNKGVKGKFLTKNLISTESESDSIDNAMWSNDSKSIILTKNTFENVNTDLIKSEKITVNIE